MTHPMTAASARMNALTIEKLASLSVLAFHKRQPRDDPGRAVSR